MRHFCLHRKDTSILFVYLRLGNNRIAQHTEFTFLYFKQRNCSIITRSLYSKDFHKEIPMTSFVTSFKSLLASTMIAPFPSILFSLHSFQLNTQSCTSVVFAKSFFVLEVSLWRVFSSFTFKRTILSNSGIISFILVALPQ